jgi:ABC-2 type transport system permease protein
MSAAEAAVRPGTDMPIDPSATARPRRLVSTRLFRSELRLIFGRRRNWAGMAVLAAVPIIIAVGIKIDGPADGGGGVDFFSAITDNGAFVALAALTLELPLFLPLAVAAIAGDSIAGEANLGTLRYLLTVPVHRTRTLAVKFAAIVVFAFAATLLVAGTGLAIGLLLFGPGDFPLLSGSTLSFSEGLWRVLLVVLYLTVNLAAVGAIGLFISTLTEQPIGATIALMILTIVSHIVDAIQELSAIHPYLFTHNWLAYGDLMRDPIATEGITRGLLSAAAYTVIFCTAAWARFAGRDVTS